MDQTPGGGGYGDPRERDPDLVLRDVVRGYITAEDAARDYDVVVNGNPPSVDPVATQNRRRGVSTA
jgi:N-methylhydantoinase B